MSPAYRQTVKLDAQRAHIAAACQEALNRLDYKIIEVDEQEFTIHARSKTPLPLTEHDIHIRLYADGTLHIEGDTELADLIPGFGTSKEAVGKVIREIRIILKSWAGNARSQE